MRMSHEAQLHERNCFLTLTYSDEKLPPNGSLRKEDFQKFMKRMRERVSPLRFKFYHCGEYGENLERPHYHAVFFGFDFDDRVYFRNINGNRYYISDFLAELWPHGHHLIGNVSFVSCQYVANYVTKKVTGEKALEHYKGREPEYATMSNGIGKEWFAKYKDDVFNGGQSSDVVVTAEGHELKPPRYYFEMFKDLDLYASVRVRGKRVVEGKQRRADSTSGRLRVREKVELSKRKTFSRRSYEDGNEDVCDP
jgi:hypothetical protein